MFLCPKWEDAKFGAHSDRVLSRVSSCRCERRRDREEWNHPAAQVTYRWALRLREDEFHNLRADDVATQKYRCAPLVTHRFFVESHWKVDFNTQRAEGNSKNTGMPKSCCKCQYFVVRSTWQSLNPMLTCFFPFALFLFDLPVDFYTPIWARIKKMYF